MKPYESLKKEIESILPKSPILSDPKHAELVLKRLLELKPNADEAMQIAALSHDIDRAITGITEKDLKDYSKINEFKKEHSIRSAHFIEELMRKHKYEEKIISKVKRLVENREFGGDEEIDLLKNADSLAYFDYNIPEYLKRNGEEQTIKKIRFMYYRLLPKAQAQVRKIKYENKEIEKMIEDAIGPQTK